MDRLWLLAVLLILDRCWKHAAVVRFFARPLPALTPAPARVSILQPILSGDPTLAACLAANLRARQRVPCEFIWLLDDSDITGQAICQALQAQFPEQSVRLLLLPQPAQGQNPKIVKLIQGLAAAQGDVICVLDDDTMLPDDGLAQCLPFLAQPGVGLVFGLPYQVNFANLWSRLIAVFVNSQSLLTYIPYTVLSAPFTINGMFYAMRRPVLAALGGFDGLETWLADDFAVAQRVVASGRRLVQTPLRHAISIQVTDARHYFSLIQRWFIFPRQSLLRHLPLRQVMLVGGVALIPALAPLLLLAWLFFQPTAHNLYLTLAYFLLCLLSFAHLNARYLFASTPWRHAWLVIVLQIVFPLQMLVALLSPQQIRWRGHLMQVEPGGGFRFIERRPDA